jgi:dTDP-4-dehydrorhamnose reductase
MRSRKVLVTGANGILGSNILKFISDDNVICYSHSDLDIIKTYDLFDNGVNYYG